VGAPAGSPRGHAGPAARDGRPDGHKKTRSGDRVFSSLKRNGWALSFFGKKGTNEFTL
jgi:hypothetical protein